MLETNTFDITTHTIFLRVRKEKIGWLKFIIDGYDGLATLSTLSVSEGLIKIWTPTSSLAQLFAVLNAVAEEITPFPTQTNAPTLD